MDGVRLDLVLEEALLEEYESWPKAMKIWPSDLGVALGPEHDGCPRAFWEKCRDAPRRDKTVGELLMFKMGDLIHEFLVEILRKHLPKHGWEVVSDEERVEAFGTSGRLDLKIRNIESGEVRVVDFKTKRGGAFRYLNEPKPGNVLQVQHYAAAADADGADLLYVDREGQNFVRQFPVDRDDARPERAVKELTVLRDGPAPPPLTPNLSRRQNKGDDSLYLKLPWQVEWCDLTECPCAAAIGSVPSGIVAKVEDDGTLRFTKAAEGHEEVIQQLFDQQFAQDYEEE